MTYTEALEEARRRWGQYAWARRNVRIRGMSYLQVGYDEDRWAKRVMGKGFSWEGAFIDADRKTEEKEAIQ